jgi:ABC-type Zn uptake system ZnuABC Zn-binding protein ZnuA
MRPAVLALALACAWAAAVAGCGSGEGDGEPVVVATTTHVGDLVANVAGGRMEVHTLLTPAADPHEYEPRPSDARAVADAAVVVRAGGEVDAWLDDVVANAGGDATVVTLSDHVRLREDDPHWWQDPANAVRAVAAIRDALIEADPEGAAAYRRNAARYVSAIRALDRRIAACMRAIPRERRKLVTTHEGYGYFAGRYGIELVGAVLPSRSGQASPSAGETAALVRRIRAEGVRAIFPESPLDPRLERAIAEEAGVAVGDRLFADALGPEGSGGDTYLRALAHDADALARGFTGGRRGCSR